MDDEDITLNLFTPEIRTKATEKPKINVWGSRQERIKTRKRLKIESKEKKTERNTREISVYDEHIDNTTKKDVDDGITTTVTTSNIIDTKKRNGDLRSIDNGTKRRRKDFSDEGISSVAVKKIKTDCNVHFSSLFNSNPEVPTIDTKHVEALKEKVFSSDSFESLFLDSYMLRNLRENMKFEKMTTVQQLSIPSIIRGVDVLVKSQTGTGKTLAYAIPIIHTLQSIRPKIKREDGVFALVIVPSRELALQSFETFQKLVKPYQWIVPGCTIGGEKRKAEKARVRKGINVLLGTPGRLADHVLHTKSLELSKLRYFIIDEADRLFDMGFEKDVKLIVETIKERTRSSNQTVLLSATLTDGVEKLAGMTLSSPMRIDASSHEGITDGVSESSDPSNKNTSENPESCTTTAFSMPEKLKQLFLVTPCKLRLVSLVSLIADKCLISNQKSKMIVFVSTQDSVEFHYRLFTDLFQKSNDNKEGLLPGSSVKQLLADDNSNDTKKVATPAKPQFLVKFYKLHGNMDQKKRTETFTKFSNCQKGVLLCTDIAARGLHLHNIKWIVQYTTPTDTKEYIHRVGRTARAGAQGNSILFLTPSETEYIKILNNMKINMKEVTMRSVLQNLLIFLDNVPKVLEANRRPPRTYEEAATTFQVYIEKIIHESPEMQEVSKKAFQSFVRGYSTYPKHLKSIFHVKFLHLGHLAKSFGLRDAPGGFSGGAKRESSATHKKKNSEKEHPKLEFHKPKRVFQKSVNMSEFSSGI